MRDDNNLTGTFIIMALSILPYAENPWGFLHNQRIFNENAVNLIPGRK